MLVEGKGGEGNGGKRKRGCPGMKKSISGQCGFRVMRVDKQTDTQADRQ